MFNHLNDLISVLDPTLRKQIQVLSAALTFAVERSICQLITIIAKAGRVICNVPLPITEAHAK